MALNCLSIFVTKETNYKSAIFLKKALRSKAVISVIAMKTEKFWHILKFIILVQTLQCWCPCNGGRCEWIRSKVEYPQWSNPWEWKRTTAYLDNWSGYWRRTIVWRGNLYSKPFLRTFNSGLPTFVKNLSVCN